MVLRFADLGAHLARELAPLYVVHGDEPLFAVEAADAIRAAARRAGCEERDVFIVEQHFRWDAFVAANANLGLFGARKMDFVNPVRQSVWDDQEFRDRIAKSYPGYLEQYEASAPGSKIYFTPQPLFFNLTTEWAASLQRMVANEVPVDEGLDQLAESVDRQLKSAGLG